MLENEVQEQVETQQEQVIEQPQHDPKEQIIKNNLANMRKQLEAEEAARKEAQRENEELKRLYAQQNQQGNTNGQPVDEDDDLGDPDEYVANKKLNRTAKKLNTKLSEADRKLQELEQKLQYFEAKSELDSIKDFNDVVTDDNLKTFARLYPDDYNSAIANPNLKAKSKHIYNMIKNYGIANASPLLKQAETMKAIDKKIEANKEKPGSAAQAPQSSSPLAKLGRYDADGRLNITEEDARHIQAEMRRKMGLR